MAATTEKNANQPKDLLRNRRARHSYHILETLEAGIELKGSEVKSLRDGGGSIVEAWVTPMNNQMFIKGMTIPPYSKASAWIEASTRDRKLLIHRREIDRLSGAVSQKGLTLIPLRVYLTEKGLIKVEIALGKGKDARDKRDDIKERDLKRELAREYKVR